MDIFQEFRFSLIEILRVQVQIFKNFSECEFSKISRVEWVRVRFRVTFLILIDNSLIRILLV